MAYRVEWASDNSHLFSADLFKNSGRATGSSEIGTDRVKPDHLHPPTWELTLATFASRLASHLFLEGKAVSREETREENWAIPLKASTILGRRIFPRRPCGHGDQLRTLDLRADCTTATSFWHCSVRPAL